MTYNEFKEYVIANIRNYLPPTYSDAEVIVRMVERSDSSYEGLIVKRADDGAVPTVNLRAYFDSMDTLEETCWMIADILTTEAPAFAEGFSFDRYEDVRDNLFITLHNIKGREDYYKTIPHRMIEDLVMSCHYLAENTADGMFSMTITNDILNLLGVDENTLFNDALRSSQRLFPEELQNLGSIFGAESGPDVVVVSNVFGINGAAALLYPGVLESLAVTDEVYILPSSVHEVLVHRGGNMDVEQLVEIVKNANQTVVGEGEWLSDHVYKYSDGKITIAG